MDLGPRLAWPGVFCDARIQFRNRQHTELRFLQGISQGSNLSNSVCSLTHPQVPNIAKHALFEPALLVTLHWRKFFLGSPRYRRILKRLDLQILILAAVLCLQTGVDAGRYDGGVRDDADSAEHGPAVQRAPHHPARLPTLQGTYHYTTTRSSGYVPVDTQHTAMPIAYTYPTASYPWRLWTPFVWRKTSMWDVRLDARFDTTMDPESVQGVCNPHMCSSGALGLG